MLDLLVVMNLLRVVQLLPEYMKDAGYETHMIGKWHLGSFKQDVIPSERGFDTFVGYLNDEETYWSHQVCVCVCVLFKAAGE